MRASVPPAAPRAGRREWIGLAVIALPRLLCSMDLTVLNLAVPHLSADLRPLANEAGEVEEKDRAEGERSSFSRTRSAGPTRSSIN